MTFFKTIWKKLIGLFSKRPPSIEKIISEGKVTLAEPIVKEDIYIKILETNDYNKKTEFIKKIAQQETAKSILDYVENEPKIVLERKKGRKNLYELHELRNELFILEEKKATLEFIESQIVQVNNTDTSSFDGRIENLYQLINKNFDKVELYNILTLHSDKSIQQLEILVTNKSMLNRYKIRVNEQNKLKELYKNKIKQKLVILEGYILQNNIEEAKILINILNKSIKPDLIKEVSRLFKAKEALKEKEILIFKRKQEEILKRQAEESKKIKELQEQELEKQRVAREQKLAKRIIEENINNEKDIKLKILLSKKTNWREFQRVLQKNNVTTLYHFTDQSNLKSIKENGGLFSWHYCDRNNIVISMTGNSSLGRSLDTKFGLEDYVRLSFIEDHPMKHVALKEGRITRPYLLKLSIDVCYFENTRFSNMNAADNKHKDADTIDFLQSLRFDLFQKKYFDLNQIEKKQHQAEVLVKTWIPTEYIININDF